MNQPNDALRLACREAVFNQAGVLVRLAAQLADLTRAMPNAEAWQRVGDALTAAGITGPEAQVVRAEAWRVRASFTASRPTLREAGMNSRALGINPRATRTVARRRRRKAQAP